MTTSEEAVKEFAKNHLTELSHLEKIESFLDEKDRSAHTSLENFGLFDWRLTPIFGSRAVFATISAVENFVVLHYQSQIHRLQNENTTQLYVAPYKLAATTKQNMSQKRRPSSQETWQISMWCRLVSTGSKIAVN